MTALISCLETHSRLSLSAECVTATGFRFQAKVDKQQLSLLPIMFNAGRHAHLRIWLTFAEDMRFNAMLPEASTTKITSAPALRASRLLLMSGFSTYTCTPL